MNMFNTILFALKKINLFKFLQRGVQNTNGKLHEYI